jgi:hypothetical protein
VFDLARRVREAGGRIEFVQDAYLNDTNEMSDVVLALAATKDMQKSRDISKQVRAAKARIAANGALWGGFPWGYASAGDEYNRRLVVAPHGVRYVPEVFTRIADGHTLPAVASWLSEATGRTFYPRVIAAMIRNTTYRGEHRDVSGRIIHRCPALVSGDLWRRANANLDGRPSSRRGQRTDLVNGAALLSGLVYCANPDCTASGDGPSPVYKIRSRVGHGDVRVDYLRCSGRGAKRRGCGTMVLMAAADDLMNTVMGGLGRPVLRPVFHPAEGHQVEIDDVNQALRDLPARGLDDDAEDAERARLRAERKRLAAEPATPAWTGFVPVLGDDGRVLTYGARWAASDQAGRRAWLKEAGFGVYLGKPGMTPFTDDEADRPDELFHRADRYENGRAALTFLWAGDDDGLLRGLPDDPEP